MTALFCQFYNVFCTIHLSNSMLWILLESIDLLDIFHTYKKLIQNYYGKSKCIRSQYNFYTTAFNFFLVLDTFSVDRSKARDALFHGMIAQPTTFMT